MSIIIFIAGAGFEAGTLDFCFLPYFVFVTAFSLSGCGSQNSVASQAIQHCFDHCPFFASLHFPQEAVGKKAGYSPVVGLRKPEGSWFNAPQRQKNKSKSKDLDYFYCGGRIWTNDLRVMSPTSYQTAPPRDI